jgi:hypothetical protein
MIWNSRPTDKLCVISLSVGNTMMDASLDNLRKKNDCALRRVAATLWAIPLSGDIMPEQLDIPTIANELNSLAAGRAIGQLQEIRRGIKGHSRRAGSTIFTSQTIYPGPSITVAERSFNSISGRKSRPALLN